MRNLHPGARLALLILIAMTAITVAAALVSCAPARTTINAITGTPNGPVQLHETGHVTVNGFHGPCAMRVTPTNQPLADPSSHCTPGAYDPTITAATLCQTTNNGATYHMSPAWDQLRAPESETNSVKYGAIQNAYNLPAYSDEELDHWIPRKLGGTNSELNLAIFPGKIPNAKDRIEVALGNWMCDAMPDISAATHRLREAQVAIATNWTTAEQVLGVPE